MGESHLTRPAQFDERASTGNHWLSHERTRAIIAVTLILWPTMACPADPPCDRYPAAKQARCAAIWMELNKEDGPIIAQFGLDQQKRRDEGKINAEQHLAENMAFIKQSTEKRLERLKARMAKD